MAAVNQSYNSGFSAPQPTTNDDASVTLRMGNDGSLTLTFDNGDIGNDSQNYQNSSPSVPRQNPLMEFLSKLFPGIFESGQNNGGNYQGTAVDGNSWTDNSNGTGFEPYTGGTQQTYSGEAGSTGPQSPEQVAQLAAFAFLNSTSFNEHFPDGNITLDRLKEMAENKDGKFDEQAVRAAQSLIDNKLAFDVIDNADRHGALNGTTDMNDLRAAAGLTPTRQAAMSLLDDQHVMEKHGGKLTMESMHEILKDPQASGAAKEAAQYFIDNPQAFADVEMADTNNGQNDGLAGISAFEAYIKQGDQGITEDQHGKGRTTSAYGASENN